MASVVFKPIYNSSKTYFLLVLLVVFSLHDCMCLYLHNIGARGFVSVPAKNPPSETLKRQAGHTEELNSNMQNLGLGGNIISVIVFKIKPYNILQSL